MAKCSLDDCNEVFEPINGKRFCSDSHRTKNNRAKYYVLGVCSRDGCEETFVGDKRKKFCSHSCSARVNNVGVRRHDGVPTICSRKDCNSVISKGNFYCSFKCRRADKVDQWLAGTESGMWKYDLADFVKEFVAERAMYQCEGIDSRTNQRCSENRIKDNGKTVCQVDHIDGNWQNSRPDNLRLLCPTCHVLTETWGASNMGSGRTWKKEYNQFSSKYDTI